MLRGGSWNNNNENNLRAANRNNDKPDNRNKNVGFRCAASVLPEHSLEWSNELQARILDFTKSKSVPEGSPDQSPWSKS